jgi:microcin C transport system substrate-binding protein
MNPLKIGLTLLCYITLSLSVSNVSLAELPSDLVWQTNTSSSEWSSEKAVAGGTMRYSIPSFPPTLRTVGPDSNNAFRSYLLDNQIPLVGVHPNTDEMIPLLATHWAYDPDGKTVHYKINPLAKWSDGTHISADDFIFALEFNRSKFIVAPWYNKHYSEQIVDVVKHDSHTISIIGATAKPKKDLHIYYSILPRAKHFHTLDAQWIAQYNWKIEPNSGAYQVSKVKKGKSITFTRKESWWANKLPYLRNRFNVKRVILKVVRDPNTAFKYFQRGELDTFNLTLPKLWHNKAQGPMFDKGFIHKITYYNQVEKSAAGLFLNLNNDLLTDINVRKAIASALNFQQVIDIILRGDYQRLPTFHTGYGRYSNTSIHPIAFNLNNAIQLLQQSGWVEKDSQGIRSKGDQRLSFKVSYGNKLYEPQVLLLVEEAKKAGIELTPYYLEATSFYKNVIEKKHDIAWLGWSTGLRPAYWQYFHSDNANLPQTNNITNLSDKTIDALIDRYRKETDEVKRIQLAHEIEQKVADHVVFIPSTMKTFTRAAFWRWLQLPETHATKSSDSLFDPFNTRFGGLFWIDAKIKFKSLAEKKGDDGFKPTTLLNTQYQE